MKFDLSPLSPAMYTRPARVMLHAIGLQESLLTYRRQHGNGPARGLWQFERGGGVVGVLTHASSKALARKVCADRGVDPTAMAVWTALEFDDVLAACFARLLLYTDPRPLPAIGEQQKAWEYYLRNWRPGKAHPETWPENYQAALRAQT